MTKARIRIRTMYNWVNQLQVSPEQQLEGVEAQSESGAYEFRAWPQVSLEDGRLRTNVWISDASEETFSQMCYEAANSSVEDDVGALIDFEISDIVEFCLEDSAGKGGLMREDSRELIERLKSELNAMVKLLDSVKYESAASPAGDA